MKYSLRIALSLAVAATSLPAAAQSSPEHIQARQMFERAITYRTSHGQGQVPAMTAYLEQVLRSGGVPAADIVKLPSGEAVAMLVRVPGTDAGAKPILFSAHMDVVDARPEDWQRRLGMASAEPELQGRGRTVVPGGTRPGFDQSLRRARAVGPARI